MTSEIILLKHHYDKIITILLRRILTKKEQEHSNPLKLLFKGETITGKGSKDEVHQEYCDLEKENKKKLQYLFTSVQSNDIESQEEKLVKKFKVGEPLYGIRSPVLQLTLLFN